MTAAIVALGDTLFPTSSLQEGLAADLSPASHFLFRLRMLHPVLALAVGLPLALQLAFADPGCRDRCGKMLMRLTAFLIGMQLLAGAVNVILLAPVWLQLVHLLLSDLIWVGLVLSLSALEGPEKGTLPAVPA